MVADGVVTSKLDSALVCEWPETIDLDKDIFIPTKVEQFKLSLVRALKSRGLWAVIAEVDPQLREIAENNPDASPADVIEAYDDKMRQQKKARQDPAILLPSRIKFATTSFADLQDMKSLVDREPGKLEVLIEYSCACMCKGSS